MITEQEILNQLKFKCYSTNSELFCKIENNTILLYAKPTAVFVYVPASFILKYGKPVSGVNVAWDIVPDIKMPLGHNLTAIKKFNTPNFLVQDYTLQ